MQRRSILLVTALCVAALSLLIQNTNVLRGQVAGNTCTTVPPLCTQDQAGLEACLAQENSGHFLCRLCLESWCTSGFTSHTCGFCQPRDRWPSVYPSISDCAEQAIDTLGPGKSRACHMCLLNRCGRDAGSGAAPSAERSVKYCGEVCGTATPSDAYTVCTQQGNGTPVCAECLHNVCRADLSPQESLRECQSQCSGEKVSNAVCCGNSGWECSNSFPPPDNICGGGSGGQQGGSTGGSSTGGQGGSNGSNGTNGGEELLWSCFRNASGEPIGCDLCVPGVSCPGEVFDERSTCDERCDAGGAPPTGGGFHSSSSRPVSPLCGDGKVNHRWEDCDSRAITACTGNTSIKCIDRVRADGSAGQDELHDEEIDVCNLCYVVGGTPRCGGSPDGERCTSHADCSNKDKSEKYKCKLDIDSLDPHCTPSCHRRRSATIPQPQDPSDPEPQDPSEPSPSPDATCGDGYLQDSEQCERGVLCGGRQNISRTEAQKSGIELCSSTDDCSEGLVCSTAFGECQPHPSCIPWMPCPSACMGTCKKPGALEDTRSFTNCNMRTCQCEQVAAEGPTGGSQGAEGGGHGGSNGAEGGWHGGETGGEKEKQPGFVCSVSRGCIQQGFIQDGALSAIQCRANCR